MHDSLQRTFRASIIRSSHVYNNKIYAPNETATKDITLWSHSGFGKRIQTSIVNQKMVLCISRKSSASTLTIHHLEIATVCKLLHLCTNESDPIVHIAGTPFSLQLTPKRNYSLTWLKGKVYKKVFNESDSIVHITWTSFSSLLLTLNQNFLNQVTRQSLQTSLQGVGSPYEHSWTSFSSLKLKIEISCIRLDYNKCGKV